MIHLLITITSATAKAWTILCALDSATLSLFNIDNSERDERIFRGSALNLREVISDAKFETSKRKSLKKPAFLFGDAIEAEGVSFYDGNYKWLRKIEDRYFFLPNMEHMMSLSYFQSLSVPRSMWWNLVADQDGVTLGHLSKRGAVPAGHGKHVLELQPGSHRSDFPA